MLNRPHLSAVKTVTVDESTFSVHHEGLSLELSSHVRVRHGYACLEPQGCGMRRQRRGSAETCWLLTGFRFSERPWSERSEVGSDRTGQPWAFCSVVWPMDQF